MSNLTAKTALANLKRAWERVEPMDIEMGEHAYRIYHETLRNFAEFYGVGFVPTVEAFVALSPNNDYHGNLRSLAAVLFANSTGRPIGNKASSDPNVLMVSTYTQCGHRALSYIKGEVSFMDTVRGEKIRSFRDNILYVNNSRRITVDGHMIAICVEKDMTMREANFEIRKVGGYHFLERVCLQLSRSTKFSPCATQAILWTSRKRIKDIKFSTQSSLFGKNTAWDRALVPQDYPPYSMKDWIAWCKQNGKHELTNHL